MNKTVYKYMISVDRKLIKEWTKERSELEQKFLFDNEDVSELDRYEELGRLIALTEEKITSLKNKLTI